MIALARRPGTFLPTFEQHHLLRAALLHDVAAVSESLRLWRTAVRLEDLDATCATLLPLLYRNLQRRGIDDEEMARLKGTYRSAWLRNEVVMSGASEAVRLLAEVGIPTILAGRAAIVAIAGREADPRPLYDFDVVVDRGDVARAATALESAGWTIVSSFRSTPSNRGPIEVASNRSESSVSAPRPVETGAAARNPFPFGAAGRLDREALFLIAPVVRLRREGAAIDLRSTPARGVITGSGSGTLSIAPGPRLGALKTFPAEEMIAFRCIDAMTASVVEPPISWIADAMILLEATGARFDWDRLVERARSLHQAPAVLRCLEHLREGMGMAVPEGVIASLEQSVRQRDRLALALRSSRGLSGTIWRLTAAVRSAFSGDGSSIPRRLRLLARYARSR